MTASTLVRRAVMVGGALTATLALSTTSASAHHCYIPMYSLNGPTSANWEVYSAERGAAEIVGFVPECEAAGEAGYAALRAARLPVGIKIFAHMTIGDPKETGRTNPNGANGKGLEYFGAGSTLADRMLVTFIGAASEYDCDA